jgi:methylthioribose-1-phosphate isomerase
VTLAPADIIRLEQGAVVMLDQTLLPQVRQERRCTSVPDLVDAIIVLAIRGAPALGVAVAMGVALAAQQAPDEPEAFRRSVLADAAIIAAAMSTLYSLTELLVLARLFSPTVMGLLSAPENTTP